MKGQVSQQDLTFGKEFRGSGGYRPGACVPALELSRYNYANYVYISTFLLNYILMSKDKHCLLIVVQSPGLVKGFHM